jgi:hypothetical protein
MIIENILLKIGTIFVLSGWGDKSSTNWKIRVKHSYTAPREGEMLKHPSMR